MTPKLYSLRRPCGALSEYYEAELRYFTRHSPKFYAGSKVRNLALIIDQVNFKVL